MGATAWCRVAVLVAVLASVAVVMPSSAATAAAATDLGDPVDMAVGADGSVYVADRDANHVVRYPADGSAPTIVGLAGLIDLTGVAVGPDGEVVVADIGRVLVLPADGGAQVALPGAGKPGYTAREVAVDGAGNVYAYDGSTVLRWANGTGTPTTHAVLDTNGLERGLAAEADGTVYVAHTLGHLVWRIPAGGGEPQPLDLGSNAWPVDLAVGPGGRLAMVTANDTAVMTRAADGTLGSIPFNHPIRASVVGAAPDGRVLVVDDATRRVVSQEPARLRVTTTPAVPARIQVDGQNRDSWGLDWMPIGLGSHEVCFERVPGYTTPPCQAVTVSPTSQTITVDGAYERLGYLHASTSPAVPSTISIDGVARNDWGLWTEVPAGNHQVCFGAVLHYQAPACRSVSVTAGQTATTVGTFTPDPSAPGPTGQFGYLRATTSPPTDIAISVDGLPRSTWGLDWLKLPLGSHQVCFARLGDISNTQDRLCTTVSIGGPRNTTFLTWSDGPTGFLRVTTNPPLPVAVTVGGGVYDAFGMWIPANVTGDDGATYAVCFGAMAGFTTPPCQNVTVADGETTEVVGTFTPTP